MKPRVFLSYRREDSDASAAVIAGQLKQRFGGRRVFHDTSGSLELGRDWSPAIDSAVARAQVTLVVIGPLWVQLLHDRAKLSADDVVVREVRQALELLPTSRRRRVISVRVDGAALPEADDLPCELQPLLRLQGASVRPQVADATVAGGEKRNVDIDALARSLPIWTRRRRRTVAAAVTAVFLIGLVLAWPSSPPPRVAFSVAVTGSDTAPTAELRVLADTFAEEISDRGASTQIGVIDPDTVDRIRGSRSSDIAEEEASLVGDDVQAVLAVIEFTDDLGLRRSGVDLFLATGTTQLAPEIAGRHVLLEPREGGLDRPGVWRTIEATVRERGGAVVDLLQSFASYDVGDLDAADASLDSAATLTDDSHLAALIELFHGVIDSRRSELGEAEAEAALDAALAHFNSALELRPGYERALLGRIQIRFLQSIGEDCESGADVAELERLEGELEPLRTEPTELAADVEYKAALLTGRVRTCLGLATDAGDPVVAREEFDRVINAYVAGRLSLRETAQLAYLGRTYWYVSFGQFEAALADLDAAMEMTTDMVRLCDALRLRRSSLVGLGRETSDVDLRLASCPT